ncbi:MAG: EpsG family protein [Candidatus Levybacteria bacterium]|nr:EpsG family protein [Candidatus Levybacteria bacterium]
MKPSFLIGGIVFISLILRLVILNSQMKNPSFEIQQDRYVDYAIALKEGTINNADKFSQPETRLFPGYPILILFVSKLVGNETVAGVVISLVSSALAIFIFWDLIKSTFLTGVFAFFPPVWVVQSTKITTEPLTVLFLLLSVVLYKRQNFFLTGLLLGAAFNIRLISLCLLLAFFVISFRKKYYKSIMLMLVGFIILFSMLFVYNFSVFGYSGLFKQFQTYYSINNVSIGGIQIARDIIRTIDWKQYRILFSGLFYLAINLFALFQLYKHKNVSLLFQISFYWMLSSLIFVFFLGPTPLLEEFSRFSVPFFPALIIGLSALIGGIKHKQKRI